MPTESITNDITSKSESEEIEKTAEEDEIDSTVKNVIKSQSPEEEVKRLRFPCSYCSRRFETLEEVKRHIINAHTPRHA
ncbi:MAG: C2H2-type zinc finger protein [Nitrososphaeraceae archaeon]